jgi:hypothetical protein
VTGGLLSNTLTAAPSPVVTENIQENPSGPTFTGSITVSSEREFAITGYVDTSHGRVQTTVEQSVKFLNTQEFDVSPTVDGQDARQMTSVDSVVTTREGWVTTSSEQHFRYPLSINYLLTFNADGSSTQVTTVNQQDHVQTSGYDHGPWQRTVDEEVESTDTLFLSPSFSITGNSGALTTQSYRSTDPASGGCYSRTLTAKMQKLTAVQDGRACGNDDQRY